MSALPERKYSLDEYLDLLHKSEERLEYFDGEVVSMAGGKKSHNRATRNISRKLGELLDGKPCEVFDGNQAVKTSQAPPFRFPDASVVCGEAIFEEMRGHDILVNPILIVEVLSPSTGNYDRDAKFLAYQAIATFREYLLVTSERPHVIQYLRQPDGRWLRSDIIGLESQVVLESLGVALQLKDIYWMVTFPESDADSLIA